MQTHHLDSPHHQEPISDPGDYLIEALENYYAIGEPWLAWQDLRKFGLLLKYSDYYNFHTSYSLLWLQMLMDYYDYYDYTGDIALVRELAGPPKKNTVFANCPRNLLRQLRRKKRWLPLLGRIASGGCWRGDPAVWQVARCAARLREMPKRFEGWIVATPDRRKFAVRITSYPELDISPSTSRYLRGRLAASWVQTRILPTTHLVINVIGAMVCLAIAIFTKGMIAVAAITAIGFFISILFPTLYALANRKHGRPHRAGIGPAGDGFCGMRAHSGATGQDCGFHRVATVVCARVRSLSFCRLLRVRDVASLMTQELENFELLVTSNRTGENEIFAVNTATGDARNLTRHPGSSERYASWSPDGSLAAFTSDRDGAYNLYLMDSDGGHLRQLTHEPAGMIAGMQRWTADGAWIYFGLFGKPDPLMGRIAPDGSGFSVIETGVDPAVSPDGRTIVFARNLADGHCLFRMETDGTGLRQLTHKENPWAGVHASWLPDGSGILYADCVDGALELFRSDPYGGGAMQLTHSGPGWASTSPSASPDMRRIAFRRCDEIFWRDPQSSERAYRESRADKRPVWIMGIDGSDPRVIEPLHYQIGIDGSRPSWRRLLTR